jgi:outer membrane protein assembly factor BamB
LRASALAVAAAVAVTLASAASLAGCGGLSLKGQGGGEPRLLPPLAHHWRQQVTYGPLYWKLAQFELGAVSPLGDRGVVTASLSGDVVAFNWSGDELWRATWGAPAFGVSGTSSVGGLGEVVWVGGVDGRVCALRAQTGQEAWCYDAAASVMAPPRLARDKDGADAGVLLFANESDQVFAVDAKTGEFRWRRERKVLGSDFTVNGHAAPLGEGGVVYAGFSDGHVMAYALSDGATLWAADLAAGEKRLRDVDASPVLYEGRLYTASFTGGLYALDAATGRVLWHRADARAARTVLIYGHVMYFSDAAGVHAADPATGEDLWLLPLPADAQPSAPVADGEYLFVSLRKKGLLVLHRASGRVEALVNPGGGFSSPPMVTARGVFALSNRGALFAFSRVRR